MKRGDAIVVRWRDATGYDGWMSAREAEDWMRTASGQLFETRAWYFGHDEQELTLCHTKPSDGGAMYSGFLTIPRGLIVWVKFNGD